MTDKEAAFRSSLDAVQEYLALQQQLGELMRTGFMHLSSARYAMGVERVSTLQLPATLTATSRLIQGDGELEIVKMTSSSKASKNTSAAAVTTAAAPPSSKGADTAIDGSTGDLIAQLGAKYGCDFDREGTPNEELLPVTDPLTWFGALVSPNLRQSQQDFAAVLQLIVALANAQKRIRDGMTLFEQKQ